MKTFFSTILLIFICFEIYAQQKTLPTVEFNELPQDWQSVISKQVLVMTNTVQSNNGQYKIVTFNATILPDASLLKNKQDITFVLKNNESIKGFFIHPEELKNFSKTNATVMHIQSGKLRFKIDVTHKSKDGKVFEVSVLFDGVSFLIPANDVEKVKSANIQAVYY